MKKQAIAFASAASFLAVTAVGFGIARYLESRPAQPAEPEPVIVQKPDAEIPEPEVEIKPAPTESETAKPEAQPVAGGSAQPQPSLPATSPNSNSANSASSGRITRLPVAERFAAEMATGTELLPANPAAAELHFAAAAKLKPGDALPIIRLAESQLAQNKLDETEQNIAAATVIDANNSALANLRGQLLLKQGKFAEAESAFAAAGADGLLGRAIMASFFDRTDEAKQLLGQAVAEPRFADAANEVLAAFAEFALYPDGRKEHLDTLLARAYNKIGYYSLAREKIQPVVASQPSYRDGWLLLGYAQYALGDLAAAKSSLQTAEKLDTTKSETQYFLGLTFFGLQDYAQAETYLARALDNGIADPAPTFRLLADAQFNQDKFAEAGATYEKMIQSVEVAPAEYTRPVYIYLTKLQDGQAAWRVASAALQRYPDSAEALNLAGWVSVENGFLPEAYQYLAKAIQINRNLPGPFYNLGNYFAKSGDTERARIAYRQAYELDSVGAIGTLAAEAYNALGK